MLTTTRKPSDIILQNKLHYLAKNLRNNQKLIIEVDGPIHDTQKQRDQSKDMIFQQAGYTILRFTNDEVQNTMNSVVQMIQKTLLRDSYSPSLKGKGPEGRVNSLICFPV